MIDFAMKVSNDSRSIDQHDFESLTSHDFNNEDIWDIAGITKFFGLSNRMANFTGMRPNDEFYGMAR
jgi:alkylhydroperoxidase family enzyme